jgi:hypothetical protein
VARRRDAGSGRREIARRQAELLRVAERSKKEIPELEAQVAAAKTARQREALHAIFAVTAKLFPKLRDALELAAAV